MAVMTQADYVLDVLGGDAVFRGPGRADPAALRTRIQTGLPYRSLESVCRRLQLTLPETATILHTPMRTLARRKRERKLQAVESDRLVRLARVAAHAVAVFGDEQAAAAWLRRPNRALAGEQPFRLLDTEVGTGQVDHSLRPNRVWDRRVVRVWRIVAGGHQRFDGAGTRRFGSR